MMLPLSRRVAVFLYCNISELNRATKEFFSVSLEAECCPDHIHMLVTIPPHMSVSGFMGYLKSKSSLMVFDRHANLTYKYGNRHFWCRGYYVDTVGKYENAIKNYIKNQLQEDIMADQLSLKEFVDPFTGSRSEKGK